MGATLAFLICSVGIAGLFYLDRDKSVRTSKSPLAARRLALDSSVETGLRLVRGGDAVRGILPQHSTGAPWTQLFSRLLSWPGRRPVPTKKQDNCPPQNERPDALILFLLLHN